MAKAKSSVAVVGGGIGGLTAALSLLRAGMDVHVYEQVRELREVGGGLVLSPNANRILLRLGLGPELAKTVTRPQSFHQRRWENGRTLLRTPLGDAIEAKFGAPFHHIHRADLLATLAAALPPERLHLEHRYAGHVDRGSRVEVEFENGAKVEVDALIGADGIHSAVRTALFGPEYPRFTGCIAYRGVVPAERLAHLNLPVDQEMWLGPQMHFVHYFVQDGRSLNFVAAMDRDSWTRESWTDEGDLDELRAAFAGWHPQVREIVHSLSETFIWALFERPPMQHWSTGRVTLLGDACHAMLPYMAQGAAQAVEDGATLSACLAHFEDVPEALCRYEELRLPRATRVQSLATRNKTRHHLPDGPEQEQRDREMATGTTDFSHHAVAWIYGHDAGIIDTEAQAAAF